jgi:hypothetical protein
VNPTLIEDGRQRLTDALLAASLPGAPPARAWAPTDEDLAEIVVPQSIPLFSTWTRRALATAPGPVPEPGQTALVVHLALAGWLREDTPFARMFPGGYRRVAPLFLPLVPWGCCTWRAPGHEHGLSYDGFVLLDQRIVWIPKPWRALGAPAR